MQQTNKVSSNFTPTKSRTWPEVGEVNGSAGCVTDASQFGRPNQIKNDTEQFT